MRPASVAGGRLQRVAEPAEAAAKGRAAHKGVANLRPESGAEEPDAAAVVLRQIGPRIGGLKRATPPRVVPVTVDPKTAAVAAPPTGVAPAEEKPREDHPEPEKRVTGPTPALVTRLEQGTGRFARLGGFCDPEGEQGHKGIVRAVGSRPVI